MVQQEATRVNDSATGDDPATRINDPATAATIRPPATIRSLESTILPLDPAASSPIELKAQVLTVPDSAEKRLFNVRADAVNHWRRVWHCSTKFDKNDAQTNDVVKWTTS